MRERGRNTGDEIRVKTSVMDLSEFISCCQSDEIETFCDEEINSVNAEFRRKMMGVHEDSRIKPVCFENFIYYLRNRRWSDARIFRSGAIKEYLALPCNRKLPKQNRDNEQTKSATFRKRVNHSRDSERIKGSKTMTELSMGTSGNKMAELSDTTIQAKSQTELDANETTEAEKGPIYSEKVALQTNSESYEEEKLEVSESGRGDGEENENESKTHVYEAIQSETNSQEHVMMHSEQDENKANETETAFEKKNEETSDPQY